MDEIQVEVEKKNYVEYPGMAALTLHLSRLPAGTLVILDVGGNDLNDVRQNILSATIPIGVFVLLTKGQIAKESRFDVSVLRLNELPDHVLEMAGLCRTK